MVPENAFDSRFLYKNQKKIIYNSTSIEKTKPISDEKVHLSIQIILQLQTYKKVSEVKFPNSFGISPDSRFTRRELHRDYVTVTRTFRH